MTSRSGGRHVHLILTASVVVGLSGQAAAQVHTVPPPAPNDAVLRGAPLDRETLYLAAERVSTAQRVPPVSLERATAEAGLRDRFVIQLDGPMTPARRAALEGAGVEIGNYIPANAYVVRLAGADPQAVARLGFVQWHGEFQTAWKVSPDLGQRGFVTAERQLLAQRGRLAVIVTLFEGEDPQGVVDEIFDAVGSAAVYYATMIGDQGEISLSLDQGDVGRLAALEGVQFVEDAPELTLRNGTTRWIAQSNAANQTPVYDAGIRGENQIVAVMDGRPNQSHCAFDGGKFLFYNAPSGSDVHGTHVAATVAGNDTTDVDPEDGVPDNVHGRGIAYEAGLVFDDVPSFSDTAMYNALLQHHNQGARIHTNSWGNDGTTNYDSLCRGIDRFSYDYEESLVLFAVTNQGTLRNPDNAKNLLAVGATQDAPSQGSHCSGGVGPTSDGRRKPEIYLPGCGTQSAWSATSCGYTGLTGTSMACPAVAGSCALVRQYYVDGFYPSGLATPADSLTPSGALIKATVLNSSVDMTGISGYPSNLEGWGRVLLDDALHFDGDPERMFVEDVRNADGLTTGEVVEHTVNVASSSPRLKVTLVWTEPPASAGTGSSPAWINDLNLEVVGPNGTYLGNVFAGGQSVTGGSPDDRNNVEVVSLAAPSPGGYTIRISAGAVNDGPQGYALVVTGDLNLGPAPLNAQLLSAVPGAHPLETPLTVDVNVNVNDDTLLGVNLHYSENGGLSYTTVPMATKGTTYSADVPGYDACEDEPAFYVTVEGSLAGVIEIPPGGASSPHTFVPGTEVVSFADDGESDMGWTISGTAVNGGWERGVPVDGNRGDPGADHDGSGSCWLTQNDLGPLSDGNSDVDDGVTVMTSPAIDASGGGTLSYAYWLNDVANGTLNEDELVVEIATNASGTDWSVARTYTTALSAWRTDSLAVPDTPTLRVRFSVSDDDPQNVVEAGIDAVVVSTVECVAVPPACVGDMDGDGDVDVFDFGEFATAFGTSLGDPGYNAAADLDGDDDVDVFDFGVFGPDFGCVP